MKKLVLGSLLLLFNMFGQQEKYICSVHEGAGFFSAFFGALNQLWWCEQNNKIPVIYWDDMSLYYQPEGYNGSLNAWEYYFEPVSTAHYEPGDEIHHQYLPPTMFINFVDFTNDRAGRRTAKQFMDRFVKVKPQIQDKVDSFYNEHFAGKKTIGIYVRGTDKWRETKPVPLPLILEKAAQYKDCQFFVATDELAILNILKKNLPGPVIYTQCFRSIDGEGIHNHPNPGKAKVGEEVLIDVLLLARCDAMIHTWSNVSMAILVFNPELDNTCLRLD